jgi:hypothetical protein
MEVENIQSLGRTRLSDDNNNNTLQLGSGIEKMIIEN